MPGVATGSAGAGARALPATARSSRSGSESGMTSTSMGGGEESREDCWVTLFAGNLGAGVSAGDLTRWTGNEGCVDG